MLTPAQLKNTVAFTSVEECIIFEMIKTVSGNPNLMPADIPYYEFKSRTQDLLYALYLQLQGGTTPAGSLTAGAVIRDEITGDGSTYQNDALIGYGNSIVMVDGIELTLGADEQYTIDDATGTVLFSPDAFAGQNITIILVQS